MHNDLIIIFGIIAIAVDLLPHKSTRPYIHSVQHIYVIATQHSMYAMLNLIVS